MDDKDVIETISSDQTPLLYIHSHALILKTNYLATILGLKVLCNYTHTHTH